VEFLSKALHEHIAISDSDLTALGQQRAMAVQQLLLTDTQLDPARVFLVAMTRRRIRRETSLGIIAEIAWGPGDTNRSPRTAGIASVQHFR